MQVYCILDEFIIGGEIQETSKKVCGQTCCCLSGWRCWALCCCCSCSCRSLQRCFATAAATARPATLLHAICPCLLWLLLPQVVLERLKELDALET